MVVFIDCSFLIIPKAIGCSDCAVLIFNRVCAKHGKPIKKYSNWELLRNTPLKTGKLQFIDTSFATRFRNIRPKDVLAAC